LRTSLASFYDEEYLQYKKSSFRRKKILALIVEKNVNPSPCAYIRLILPCLEKYGHEKVVLKCIDVDDLKHFSPDEIITHRAAIEPEKLSFFFEYIKNKNIPYSFDLDDDLIGVGDSSHPEANHYKKYQNLITQLIINANRVTVSTKNLKQKLEPIRADISVVKNQIVSGIWRQDLTSPKDKKRNFNVLYMGTVTHADDLEMIDEALREVRAQYREIVFNIIGVTNDRESKRYLQFIEIPPLARKSYPLFVEWLKSLGNFDLGLAPLVDNDFNRSKSGIKFLEYQALGIPVVASNLPPYSDVILDNADGLLVDNNTKAWVDGILHFYGIASKK
jgi:glycosyltransferase involved in cell wall biosynthesis